MAQETEDKVVTIEDKVGENRRDVMIFIYGGASEKKHIITPFKAEFKHCKNRDEVVALYNRYIPYLTYGLKVNSILAHYTTLRKEIKSLNTKALRTYALEHVFSLGEVDITKGIYGYRDKKSEKAIGDKKYIDKDWFKRDDKFIEKMDTLVNTIKNRVENNNYSDLIFSNQTEEKVKFYYLTMLMSLSTGRRMLELLKTIEISVKKGAVHYKGFVKKPIEKKDLVSEGYLLFITPNEAKKYLKNIRSLVEVEGLTNKEINKKYSNVLNSALNRVTKDILGGFVKFHDLRAFYARYVYIKYGARKNESDLDFLTRILHHEKQIQIKPAAVHYHWVKK